MDKIKISRTTVVNIVILLLFTTFFLIKQNYEFIVYTLTIGALIYFIEKSDRVFKYTRLAKTGFAVWLFLHLAGGAFSVNGTRIYDTILVELFGEPYNILRYDQVIHAYCYFVITLFVYSIVLYVTKQNASRVVTCVITVLAAMGGKISDPFSGEGYRWDGAGRTFYSVGLDGKDSGSSIAYDPTNGTFSAGDIMTPGVRGRR